METTTLPLPLTRSDGGFTPQVIGGIVLAVWTLFSNIVLVLAILRSEHRRKVNFYLHVCNLCLADLLMGSLVLPMFIDYNLQNKWIHSDNFCRIWLMAEMMVTMVSVLVLASMIFDRFFLFSCPDAAEGCCKFVLSATMIVLPWAISSAVVLPVYLFGETGMGVKEDEGICLLHLSKAFGIIAKIACFAAPALIAFALLVLTSLIWCIKREELREMEFSEEREHKGWQVFTSWIITLAVLGMWFPFFALHTLSLILEEQWPEAYWRGALWLGYANSGLNPILCMIMPRLRQSIKALFCCCCNKHRYEDDYLDDDETSAAMIEFTEK